MGGMRYFGGALAFGFAAVWIMATLAAALVCLSAALAGYSVVLVAERMQAKRASRVRRGRSFYPSVLARPSRAPGVEDLPGWADTLNSDLGHIYNPSATTSPLSREADYGWPQETAITSGTLQ